MNLPERLRAACAEVAASSTHVRINIDRIGSCADDLRAVHDPAPSREHKPAEDRELAAAYWLTLNAVNFGSGWFPTLAKTEGMTGFRTIKLGIDRRFRDDGPWSASQLQRITATEISILMGQEPDHPLMPLFKESLGSLGASLQNGYEGSFTALVDSADGSAVKCVELLSTWPAFADSSSYRGLILPFLKRAQLVCNDLDRAGVVRFTDLSALTLFADNLVPHVLRLDGVLEFEPALLAAINAGELIPHDSEPEVEMRACAVHAVELLAGRTGLAPAELDELLWNRGQGQTYKSVPRPRSRSTAY